MKARLPTGLPPEGTPRDAGAMSVAEGEEGGGKFYSLTGLFRLFAPGPCEDASS